MKIRIKLMGLLKSRTPSDGGLTLPDQASIREALSSLHIPPESVQVFSVNGDLVRDPSHRLCEGDELMILPPVGGG
jgi:sulfur carrier protein ThiS